MNAASLLPGARVLLDVEDSPYGTWRRGDRATVLRPEGRYFEVRIERNGVALTFDRRELIPVPAGDADVGSASLATFLAACVVGGLLLLAFLAAGAELVCAVNDPGPAYCWETTS